MSRTNCVWLGLKGRSWKFNFEGSACCCWQQSRIRPYADDVDKSLLSEEIYCLRLTNRKFFYLTSKSIKKSEKWEIWLKKLFNRWSRFDIFSLCSIPPINLFPFHSALNCIWRQANEAWLILPFRSENKNLSSLKSFSNCNLIYFCIDIGNQTAVVAFSAFSSSTRFIQWKGLLRRQRIPNGKSVREQCFIWRTGRCSCSSYVVLRAATAWT